MASPQVSYEAVLLDYIGIDPVLAPFRLDPPLTVGAGILKVGIDQDSEEWMEVTGVTSDGKVIIGKRGLDIINTVPLAQITDNIQPHFQGEKCAIVVFPFDIDTVIVGVSSVNGQTGTVNLPFATQAEAEAGTNTTKFMNPLATKQAITELTSSANLPIPPRVIAGTTLNLTIFDTPNTLTFNTRIFGDSNMFDPLIAQSAFNITESGIYAIFANLNIYYADVWDTPVYNFTYNINGGTPISLYKSRLNFTVSVNNIVNLTAYKYFQQGDVIRFQHSGQRTSQEPYILPTDTSIAIHKLSN